MSGKNRLYFSFQNFVDIFKTIIGINMAFWKLLFIYPDIIFSKGGYDSVPTCIAAYLLRIPIIMHDSDSIPGRASLLISKMATRIAISYKETSGYYKDQSIVAYTGQPIMEKYTPSQDFKREESVGKKNILITAGSQGSQNINDAVLQVLPELTAKYNIIHQTGTENINDVKLRSSTILENYNKNSYAPYALIDFAKVYPQIDLVISRGGSSMFEFSAWQIPAIIIPIPENISRDQVVNAINFEKKGLVKIIYENNLSGHLLMHIMENVLENKEVYNSMVLASKANYKKDGALKIAKEIINICQSHS
jgi:UDP-N-acetylglucosamine--N-acetylmuramyl-(pentapeptide) pyrophosphoryl-undecaprenol N-acetylglucosamine transferase